MSLPIRSRKEAGVFRRLAALSLTPLLRRTALSRGHARPARAAHRTPECQGDWLPGTPTADDVMRGEISLVGLPAYKVGKKINWAASPYQQPVLGDGLPVAALDGPRSWPPTRTPVRRRYLDRAEEITKDWVTHNGGARAAPALRLERPPGLAAQPGAGLPEHAPQGRLAQAASPSTPSSCPTPGSTRRATTTASTRTSR